MPSIPPRKLLPWEIKTERKTFTSDAGLLKKYNSQRWRKLSKWNLRNNPLCCECEEKGLFKPAKVTDHKHPVSKGGDFWDTNNFQSLCISCHNSKSAKEK